MVYNDKVTGIDSEFIIGDLSLSMDQTDLQAMIFTATSGTIKNSTVTIKQSPIPFNPNAEETPLPFLAIEELEIENLDGTYEGVAFGIIVNYDIKELYAEVPKADLKSTDVEITELILKNSVVDVFSTTPKNEQAAEEVRKSTSIFPDVNVIIDNATIVDTDITYRVDGALDAEGVFNPNNLTIDRINLDAKEIFIDNTGAGALVTHLNGTEGSGLKLKALNGNFKITNTTIEAQNFYAALNNNILGGRLDMNFPSFDALTAKPETAKIDLNLPKIQIDLKEVFKFQPDLRSNSYVQELSKRYISGSVNASGTLADISIPNLKIDWGASTSINANGSLKNITDVDNLYVNLPNVNASTVRKDVLRFVSEDSLGIKLPENIDLDATVRGSLTDIFAKAELKTSQGIATIDGRFKNEETISFDATAQIKEYKLSELLQNDQIGALSVDINATGQGTSINTLDAKLDATITEFGFKDYAIEDLNIKADIINGSGTIASAYKDENLNATLDGTVVLDSVAPKASINLNVIGANLQALGLMRRDVRTGLKLKADFNGNATSYNVSGTINDGVIVYDNHTYLLGDLTARARVRPDTTSVKIQNKLIDLTLQSNADPARFVTAVQEHIQSYFYRDAILPDTIANPVNISIRGKIRQAPILNEVFLVNVKDLDTITLNLDFKQAARKMSAFIEAPHINYSGNEIDSLSFRMETDKQDFNFNLGFNEINAGPIAIKKTELKGSQVNNELALEFTSYDDEEKLIHVASQITGSRERLRYHVLPEDLIFNRNKWETPSDNEMIITDQKLAFNDFRFFRNGQSTEITDKLPNIEKDHIAIDFQNFKLSEFLSYLNPDEKLATGRLNGDLVIEEPFGDLGLLADLFVENFSVMNVDMGRLEMDARSLSGDKYDFDLGISGGSVVLDLIGDYIASEDGADLNMELDLKELKMKALEGFSRGEIINGTGSMSGDFSLNGKLTALDYEGELRFKNATFTIAKLNAPFTLKNERLSIDNEGISMSAFTILDENGNSLIANGEIGTESFINPTFDVQVTANDFQALNATEEDNDFIYGKAVFDADVKLTGDLDIPVIDLRATVNSETDVTYVMPTATANIESREGIVIFVNRENPDAILTQTEEETGTITGFDVKALLKVTKEAKVKIIIDKETGDNFQVYGDGDFNYTMTPNGRMNLTGVYDIAGGAYEMNLYNLVNRRFELAPSSRVSWSGDPFDAKLDVRAIYKVETSASGLMAAASSNLAPSARDRYRQQLPFLVYLNVDGDLLSPKISFALDMPEDEQGSVGGEIYGRVQQINQQEGELNRQVFSLLVLNRFYPDSGSDGSGGGFASIARDNLNDALSDQLNVFSDKLLGDSGVELDFGLDSFTDYQGSTPQERTQLDIAAQKKLFDDRLIVRVGSSVDIQGESTTDENTPLIGNVSLEYLLTEDGRYRLKGFRRNEFENVIDGQTLVSGISLIFTQEFNQFSELWDAILRSKTKQLREEEARKKQEEEKKEKEKEQSKPNAESSKDEDEDDDNK